jgi:N-acetylneuraminic acid mutarotase
MTRAALILVLSATVSACSHGTSGNGDGGGAPDLATSSGLSWQVRTPLPAPRQETAVVALGGRVYVIGGFDINQAVVATVEAWDPVADRWSAVAPLPMPTHHVNAAAVGNLVYALGGLRTSAFTAVGDCWAYDPATDHWSARAAMPTGTQRGASMVGVVGTRIYVAGGFRGSAVADFAAYDTVADSWTVLPPLPTPRDHGVGGAVGTVMLAIGGRDTTPASHVPRVDAFDTVAGAWSARAPLPTSRGGAAAGVLDGSVIVAGGEGNPGSPRGVFAAVEVYNVSHDSWSSLPPMRTPRHGTGGAVVGRTFVVPGGADIQVFGAVNVVESLTLP